MVPYQYTDMPGHRKQAGPAMSTSTRKDSLCHDILEGTDRQDDPVSAYCTTTACVVESS